MKISKRINIFKAKPTLPQVQNLTHLFLESLTYLIIIMMVIIPILTFLSFCTQCTFILRSIDEWDWVESKLWVYNRKLHIPMTTPSIVLHQPLIDSLCILLAPLQQSIYMALFVWAQNESGRKMGSQEKGYLGIGGGRRNTWAKEQEEIDHARRELLVWEAKRCGDQKKDNWDPLRWFVK
jgi:hypothetical protein